MNPSNPEADKPETPHAFSPEVKKGMVISVVWLIPLLTLVLGIWLVVKTVTEKGPLITITFNSAEGVEAGKTRVKYKNVDIGLVKSINFTEDFRQVDLAVQMDRQATAFLKSDSQFWVVRPRLTLRGASGLGTLVSGAYIELEPGEGKEQRHFLGLEDPPVLNADEPGRRIMLKSAQLGSIDIGSPVYYRGIVAGEVQGYGLGSDHRSVNIHAFIKSPFDELVNANSRFWNVSGIDITMDTEGFMLRTESLQSMLLGGIAFDTARGMPAANQDIKDKVFNLYANIAQSEDRVSSNTINYVLFFDGSVRGLQNGAPVEFKGIRIGQVIDVSLEFDPRESLFRIPVTIEIQPERLTGNVQGVSPRETLSMLVEQGLRARLQTGSLLTGKLFVELDMYPDSPARLVSQQGEVAQLPTIPAEFDEITSMAKRVLAKLDSIEFAGISDELHGTLKGFNKLANGPELEQSITELAESLKIFKQMMTRLDPQVEPLAKNMQSTLKAGRDTLLRIQKTMGLVDNLLSNDSPLQFSIIEMADEMTSAATAIQDFLELLEDNPQSLIFGKGNEN